MYRYDKVKYFLILWTGMYVILYIFPFPFTYIPFFYEFVGVHYGSAVETLNLWVGRSILGIEGLEKIQMTGSGDTTYDYVLLFTWTMLSLLGAVIVLFFRRRDVDGRRFYGFTVVLARHFVGMMLISYGVAKFMEGQFPGPSILSLEKIYGEMSPMGLAWRFFGYSETYKTFMGLSEIIPGVLLLVRRTSVVGALLAIAVTTNIVLVNLSFDVPVKLFSTHLLLFSVLVIIPYTKPMFEFFVMKKQSTLPYEPFGTKNRKIRVAYLLFKIMLVGAMPIAMLYSSFQSYKYRLYANAWDGAYHVKESVTQASEDKYPSKVVLDGKSLIMVSEMNQTSYYQIQEIEEGGQITFIESGSEESIFSLNMTERSDSLFLINVHMEDVNYQLLASRKVRQDYLLVNRGFHWINEYPFNR